VSRERWFFVGDVLHEWPAEPLKPITIVLEAGEAHHLVHVLRLTVGAIVTVFDGRGHAAEARITRVGADGAELELATARPPRESPLGLTLAVAVPKGDKMSGIVQKLTELGVAAIHPLVTDRGEVDETAMRKKLERWRRVALEAAKQCGRARVPHIEEPSTFDELARPGGLILTPGADPIPPDIAPGPILTGLIGPEGGWSEEELAIARERSLRTFSLGTRILRTETAAIAVATLLQWRAGDLG